ncbi:unnamed protein product [Ixodes persulcatus]
MHATNLKTYVNSGVSPKGLSLYFPPSMHGLCQTDLNDRNAVLKTASLKLTKIIVGHCEKSAATLKSREIQLEINQPLTVQEKQQIESFEAKKRDELERVKLRKRARDNVPLPRPTSFERSMSDERVGDGATPGDRTLKNVVNLSDIALTPDEQALLSRGLQFCPTTGQFSELSLLQDLDNFARNLRLREYFQGRPKNVQDPLLVNTDKSWTPNANRDKHLDLYIKAVQKDVVAKYRERRPHTYNLSSSERDSLKSLSSRRDIIIKPADKGGAIVVMNSDDYLYEGHRELRNTSFYQALEHDPTKAHSSIVLSALTDLKDRGKISTAIFDSLKPKYPKVGRFYMLPKIHKAGNPGRPIISGTGTLTEPISSFIDRLISGIPPTFDSFVKDTNHFLSQISTVVVPIGSFLVTLNVSSLYTNIPHDDGIASLIDAYESVRRQDLPDCGTLATLARLVLELNSFEFNDNFFLQVSGTEMGTRMAPNYTNIFMNRLEKTFLSDRPLRPLFYRRYIDDIFLIWEHTEDQLLEFIRDFNSAHPDIKFTHTYSQAEVNFLDVTVLVVGESLKTKLYRKPTDSLKYLHYNSCHPRHCKTSIPYGQSHRFRRICSDEGDFNTNAAHLRSALIEQNYPPPVVDSAIERARALDRDKLLTGTPPDRRENRKNNLVLTYSNNTPNINNILKIHFNIIQQSERLRNIIPSPPRAVFRRPRNLKDMIVRARTTPVENIGSRPCFSPRCEVCPHVSPTLTARSTG